MAKMRSIRETAKIFKEMDPETEITEYTIRKMIAEGSISAFKTGCKYLINVDELLNMFDTPCNGIFKIKNAGSDIVVNK